VKTDMGAGKKFDIYNTVVRKDDPSITMQSQVDADMMLEMADMSGRLVYNKKMRINKGVNLIDFSDFRPGTGYYVLVARTPDDIIKHKIIIQ
jgi:hypothetical protein